MATELLLDSSSSDPTTNSQINNTNLDQTMGIIICIIIVLVIIVIVIVALYSDKSSKSPNSSKLITNQVLNRNSQDTKSNNITDSKTNLKIANPTDMKTTIRPRIPDLIDGVLQTRRRMNGVQINPFRNNYVAAQILQTLQLANTINDLGDHRLPYVIDLAVVMPGDNDPFTDRKLQEILMISANETRDKIIGRNRAVARTQPTPAARMDKYIELSTTNTSDDQNSHDTYVNKCLRNIIAILREDQKNEPLPSMYTIRCEFQRRYNIDPPKEEDDKLDSPKQQSVLTVIDLMNNNGASHFNSTLQCTEAELLQRVYLRIMDKRNENVQQQMFDMVYTALGSCFEGNSIVCINGRCAKILSAIVVLDFDERTHELKTLEQFKNNIYIKTRELVKDRARKALTSTDPKVVAVAKSFLAEKIEDMPKDLDSEANSNFIIYLRKQIETMVKEQSKDLPAEVTKHIISDCIAAI